MIFLGIIGEWTSLEREFAWVQSKLNNYYLGKPNLVEWELENTFQELLWA